jgi:hypothetical protein
MHMKIVPEIKSFEKATMLKSTENLKIHKGASNKSDLDTLSYDGTDLSSRRTTRSPK